MDTLQDAIAKIDASEPDPNQGLNEDVFYMVSRLTPMVNVDLLIRDDDRRILLTWRSDAYYADGWHIPGGIVRFKETFGDRIHKVAAQELGTKVSFAQHPQKIQQIFANRNTRGHFISFLYNCQLEAPLPPDKKFLQDQPAKPGQWCWFQQLPDNLLDVHKTLYGDLFNS